MAESTFISNFIVLPSEPFRKDAAANSDGGSITVCTRLIGGARMVNRNRSVTSTRHQAGITRLRAIEFPMGVFTSFATRQQMETRTFDEPTGAQRTETDDSAGNRPQGAAPPHQTGNWLSDTTASPALSQTRTHDKANQITDLTGPSGVIDPVYDPVGNMTTMPKPGAWTTAFTCKWDAWNRLIEVKQGTTQVSLNDYDALHRRIRKTAAAETRDYYFDQQWRAIEERVSGVVKAQHTWSPLDRWTLIRRKRSVSGTLDETLFCLKDYLDPAAVVNRTGAVQERYSYDAFGPVRFLTPTFGPRGSSSFNWNFLFHAEFLDPESGLYNYGYRFYHPSLGRWISRDPIGEDGGWNLYGFVGNESSSENDLIGLAWPIWQGLKTGELPWNDWYGSYGGAKRINGILYPKGQLGLLPTDIGPPVGPPPISPNDDCYLEHDKCIAACSNKCPKPTRIEEARCITECDSKLQICLLKALGKKKDSEHESGSSLINSLVTIPIFSLAHPLGRIEPMAPDDPKMSFSDNPGVKFILFRVQF